MTQQHPITPPPDLIHNWCQLEKIGHTIDEIIILAARWGADTELDACVEWLASEGYGTASLQLWAASRPKQQSLKEQALAALPRRIGKSMTAFIDDEKLDVIRRALESLPN